MVLRGKRLIQILLDAIETLRPPSGTASDSRAWRTLQLLELRYVDGLSAGEVMDRLAISKAQYQRDHARGLAAVSSVLRDQLQIQEPWPQREQQSREALALTEADNLATLGPGVSVNATTTLDDILAVMQRVCTESRVVLSLRLPQNLPLIQGDHVVVQQVFLGLLSAALEGANAETMEMSLTASEVTVDVEFVATRARPTSTPIAGWSTTVELEVAGRLVRALGGTIKICNIDPRGCWRGYVTLPVATPMTILIVDNHPDFISLMTRYIGPRHWRVVGTHDAVEAERLARQVQPRAILLDVMMPGQDGWDLLSHLKALPETRHIPVIVCSVLVQPQIARALGAAGHLPKPVSQSALLATLAEVIGEGTAEVSSHQSPS